MFESVLVFTFPPILIIPIIGTFASVKILVTLTEPLEGIVVEVAFVDQVILLAYCYPCPTSSSFLI